MIRTLPDPEVDTIEVLGVDDWAKRKGQSYGTILVDQERRKVIDVLEDRTAETLAMWLSAHREIKIVSRDRSKTYAEGIRQGAPQALQVADRWHLLKNGSDTVYKIFQQEHATIQKRLKEVLGQTEPPVLPLAVQQQQENENTLTIAEQNRLQRIDEAQKLINLGLTRKEAARQLNIHPKTVKRYLNSSSPKHVRSGRRKLLDSFKLYLVKRWNEGCHNATQLFREIQAQGYAGHKTLVRGFVQKLRIASGVPPKVRKLQDEFVQEDIVKDLPSIRTLTWWVFRPIHKRRNEDELILNKLVDGQPKLQISLALARDFADMIRNRKVDELTSWINRAKASGCRVWSNFADRIQQDRAAVRAALSLPWSNGRTEGNVNRLKYLKRMMYGRAKNDLLRKRVLFHGCLSFT